VTWSPSSPVTGGAQTGLTSPTYTLTADTAPDSNGKQYAITALGGTQTGVIAHSVAAPFTSTFTRPKNLRPLPRVNQLTGALGNVPRNVYTLRTRKGVLPLAGQAYQIMQCITHYEIPAGADLADSPNIRAGLSLHIGMEGQTSSGIGDTCINGVL
jgi:hypothetical protein